MSERLMILVPTVQDMQDPMYRETYWPNFVDAVRAALARASIACRIVVGQAE